MKNNLVQSTIIALFILLHIATLYLCMDLRNELQQLQADQKRAQQYIEWTLEKTRANHNLLQHTQ